MNTFIEPTLWAHQKEAVRIAKNQDNFAFLFDCGTGKSATCIHTLRWKYEQARSLLPTLILAPVIVLENWKNEIAKFSRIPEENVIVLSGSSAKRIESFRNARVRFKDKFIAVTNYEILATCKSLLSLLTDWSPHCLVVDESQRIKNISSKRTKEVIKLASTAKNVYLLSGSPILNTPMDIFSQWLALDKGETFGKNFFTFRSRFFYDKNANMPRGNYFPNWQIRPDSYEEIKALIQNKSMIARKQDCLDLPPLVKQVIKVDMTEEQQRHYDSMRDYLITYLSSSSVVADMALTKMLRLVQITSGFMKDENDKIYEFNDTPKKKALEEILEQLTPNHKVIIWCVFKENYKQVREVCENLGVKYVEAHGEVSTTNKYKSVDLFNNNQSIRCFIGHPTSLGIGINLCSASYSIVYSRSWSLENDLQSEARNYRAGSEIHQKITKIDLVVKDTIDEGIIKSLENKLTDANKITGMLRSCL